MEFFWSRQGCVEQAYLEWVLPRIHVPMDEKWSLTEEIFRMWHTVNYPEPWGLLQK